LHNKIQARFPHQKDIFREIFYSCLSMIIFISIGVSVFQLKKLYGLTLIYNDINQYGVWYIGVSILLMLFIHDTYFYWTHRLMHHKKIFKYVHRIHHLSHNPTPFTAFAFHPIEAVIEALIFPILVFILPVHFWAIFGFITLSLFMNVLGHLGFEIYPAHFLKTWFGALNNTSTHHNIHHQVSNVNYGLYFNFWDSVMGTNHVDYKRTFERIASRQPESNATEDGSLSNMIS
jgi:sterol desaturase/sphingolipid hydroxylase (fatty acid hydroxylase superfamily)